jgi:diadenosine tetraphosphate (Ap4A) HIT family hydrolase
MSGRRAADNFRMNIEAPPDCLFCRIAAGAAPAHRIWENETHLAFLSIFPNTPGFSVVIPKAHYSSYAFAQDGRVLCDLVLAAGEVGRLLDRKLADVGRTGLIFEGFGIDHLHAKLFPMHGTAGQGEWKPIHSTLRKRFDTYEGYLSSHDGPRADDAELAQLAALIRE